MLAMTAANVGTRHEGLTVHRRRRGGGPGVMTLSAQAFCDTPGDSIGIVPGEVAGWADTKLGTLSKLTLIPKNGYPNPWVEIPIFTHSP